MVSCFNIEIKIFATLRTPERSIYKTKIKTKIIMSTEERIKEMFLTLSRTKKVEFISDNIDYASDRAIVRHLGAYICDFLEELWDEEQNREQLITFLNRKGYTVEKGL